MSKENQRVFVYDRFEQDRQPDIPRKNASNLTEVKIEIDSLSRQQ